MKNCKWIGKDISFQLQSRISSYSHLLQRHHKLYFGYTGPTQSLVNWWCCTLFICKINYWEILLLVIGYGNEQNNCQFHNSHIGSICATGFSVERNADIRHLIPIVCCSDETKEECSILYTFSSLEQIHGSHLSMSETQSRGRGNLRLCTNAPFENVCLHGICINWIHKNS